MSSMALLVRLLVSLCLCAFTAATFNYTSCPAPWELQSDLVKKSFNLTKFQGTYYELALHDYTQYPICPSPSCMRSHKVVDYELEQINDTGNLDCFGEVFLIHLHFNLTKTPGYFLVYWKIIPGILFPDTVVEVYENSDGVYEWIIEFQCVEKFGRVLFVGINWYCRESKVSEEYYENLLKVARSRGLGVYMDKGEGVSKVYQENCKYG